jgi:hypothetical protein
MDISFSAVTENKRFSKAFIRVAGPLYKIIGEYIKDISTANEPFDILQVVFMDEPESYIEVEGAPRGSRLFQVLAGLPRDLNFKPQDDPILVSAIEKQILVAIDRSSLSKETKLEAITRMRDLMHTSAQD